MDREEEIILETDTLLRRIPFNFVVPKADSPGELRVASQGFQNYIDRKTRKKHNEFSCYVRRILEAHGKSPEDVAKLGGPKDFVVEFSVTLVRSLVQSQSIEFVEETLPGHVHIIGKKTGATKSALANGATIVHAA